MFLKHYLKIFVFKFQICSEEADAQNWLATRDVENLSGKEFISQDKVLFEVNPYIVGRGIPITIPQGTRFKIKPIERLLGHIDEEKRFLCNMIISHGIQDYDYLETRIVLRGEEASYLCSQSLHIIETETSQTSRKVSELI